MLAVYLIWFHHSFNMHLLSSFASPDRFYDRWKTLELELKAEDLSLGSDLPLTWPGCINELSLHFLL
jgi:hypothetical protein